MKKNEIITKVGNLASRAGFQLKKQSPVIFIVAGIGGVVVGTIMACKATTKLDDILAETEEKVDKFNKYAEKGDIEIDGEKYTEEDAAHDTRVVYLQTGLKIAKLYAPAVAVELLSITSIVASHKILSKRNAAIAAAYTTIEKSFKDYRGRVVEQFGKETDYALRHGIKAERVNETVVDEDTGKEKKVKSVIQTVNKNDISGYARFFDKYAVNEKGEQVINDCWEPNFDVNMHFLLAQQRYANDLLISRGHITLNEVYHLIGLPDTNAGLVVGWVYDPQNPVGDNFIDFGISRESLYYADDDDDVKTPAILLDFNPDGNILNRI